MRLNKFRNFNYIKTYIDKMLFILREFYSISPKISKHIKLRIIKRNYNALQKMKKILDTLCLIKERRSRMYIKINNQKQAHDLAQSTLDYLNKKLSSKNKKKSQLTARNIINLITTRLTDDQVLVKELGDTLSNKKCLNYCKKL